MSAGHEGEGCHDLLFRQPLAIEAGAQVALEDYARVVAHARAAAVTVASDPDQVLGVHLCGAEAPGESVRQELEAFARELVTRSGGGLGWS